MANNFIGKFTNLKIAYIILPNGLFANKNNYNNLR
jgi:hypothetical protein